MYVSMAVICGTAVCFVLMAAVAFELWRAARDTDEAALRNAFTARFQRLRAEEAEARVRALEALLHLSDLRDRDPDTAEN